MKKIRLYWNLIRYSLLTGYWEGYAEKFNTPACHAHAQAYRILMNETNDLLDKL